MAQTIFIGGASTGTVTAGTAKQVKTGAGQLVGALVTVQGSAATTFYDGTDNTGTVIGYIPATPTTGTMYTFNTIFRVGLYIADANCSGLTVSFN